MKTKIIARGASLYSHNSIQCLTDGAICLNKVSTTERL